jgi:uncharacterized alpha-E superfamily protein
MLLSRVAESVYWAGRYLERTEATARLVKVHTELYCDLPLSCGVGWSPLLAVTGSREAFDERHPTPTEDQVVAFLSADPDQSGSIVAAVAAARHNLKVTRNLLPPSTWEAMNDLHHWVADTGTDAIPRRSRLHWMDQVIRHCHLISGSMAATMCRDDAHAFLEVGRHLERADMTTRVLDVQAGILVQGTGPGLAPYSDITWMSVLRSLAADHMFRRSTLGVLSGPEALRFLLKDPTFPRSVERSLTEISRALIELPGHDTAMATTASVQASLEDVDVDSLAEGGLHEFVDTVQEGLATVHGELAAAYFQPVASGDAVSV